MVWMEKAERRSWLSRTLLLAIPSCALLVALSSCSEARIIGTAVPPEGGTFSPLAPVDASDSEAEAGLISYCPSSQCPAGWTTCPDSRFPCDTNILADNSNCGGCGMACPPGSGAEQFTCSDGACKLECVITFGLRDCDGLVDNGCESGMQDRSNCGACGMVCAVGEECIWQDKELFVVGCGCPPGKVLCNSSCMDLSDDDDANCGACGNACDPTGGPDAEQYSNMYYGCASGRCGALKCASIFADCDGDIDNGCEASTFTDDNCGYCGNKCGTGQRCGLDNFAGPIVNGRLAPSCLCGPGLTFCQTGEKYGLPEGDCVDLRSSATDCGACGVSCAISSDYHTKAMCDFGKCAFSCLNGSADCNGSQSDGCEVDTKSDPRNCGGCGITCDLMIGQACVAGKCVVEPCDQADAGVVTR